MAGIMAAIGKLGIKGSMGGALAGLINKPTPPSVVRTAGASNMSGRIESIESRLQALEGNNADSASPQPAAVAPAETSADPTLAQAAATAAQERRVASQNMATPAASASVLGGALANTGLMAPEIPSSVMQSAELESKFIPTPFFQRQRTNSGPLNLNSPLNGNAFAKAVQDAKASGASSFEVGGKTYNVK